jgi:hypothetical protein
MPNRIFQALLDEQIGVFKNSFSMVSREIFVEPTNGRLRHPGEFGAYRETACRNFLRNFLPQRLELGNGFLINAADEVSHQCDIVAYDSGSTPLIQSQGRQRFFPIETVSAVGEVKSSVSKRELADALERLAHLKRMRENIVSPAFIYREQPGQFSPSTYHYDQLFTFLICQRLDFDLTNLPLEMDSLYGGTSEHRFRHNLILSIENGLLLYTMEDGKSIMFPNMNGKSLRNRLIIPSDDPALHFKYFASYFFIGTNGTSILFPEMVDYLGPLDGGLNHTETVVKSQ